MKDIVEAVLPHGTRRIFKKGSVLLYQGEAPRMAYVIKSGNIKVYTIGSSGEEQVVAIHTANDFFPTPWLFKKAATSLYYYETTTSCELITIVRGDLLRILNQPAFLPKVVDYLATNYVGMLVRATALQQSRAREKIMFTMYYLLFKYGRETKRGQYKIQLPLTHNDIASLIGLTRETTTTELNTLKHQKVLSYSRRIYTVNKTKLERMIGEESFADLTLEGRPALI